MSEDFWLSSLVHFANGSSLFGMMVFKDMLYLRLTFVVVGVAMIGYFLLLPTPLYEPAGWQMLFTVVNFHWSVKLIKQRMV